MCIYVPQGNQMHKKTQGTHCHDAGHIVAFAYAYFETVLGRAPEYKILDQLGGYDSYSRIHTFILGRGSRARR